LGRANGNAASRAANKGAAEGARIHFRGISFKRRIAPSTTSRSGSDPQQRQMLGLK